MVNRRKVLGVKGKAERASQRAQIGKLQDLVVSQSTQKRYFDACGCFFAWFKEGGALLPCTFSGLDEFLGEYISLCWEEGESRSLCANLLSGIQHYCPAAKRQIPLSWRLLGAWQRNELPARAPPFTEELVFALAGAALERSRGDIALLIILGFDLILRTGELLRIACSDISIDRFGKSAVVNLGSTKSGQRHGALESVTVNNSLVISLLAAFVKHSKPGDLILRTNQADFRYVFKKLCDDLQLNEWGFKPYSLRRGGATHHFRQTGQLSATIVRGRWGSAKTARVYINDGLATLASYRFDARTSAKIKVATDRFREACGQSQE